MLVGGEKEAGILKKSVFLILILALTGLCWLVSMLWLGNRGGSWQVLVAAGCVLAVTALVWAALRVGPWVWLAAGLLTLLGLVIPSAQVVELGPGKLGIDTLLFWGTFFLPSLGLIVAAMLLSSGLKLLNNPPEKPAPVWLGAACLFLSGILLIKIFYNLYWLLVWDSTTDSLDIIWLFLPLLAALVSGLLLALTLPGRKMLAGLLYAMLVPALLAVVFASAKSVDWRKLTERRAELISQAIETYHARNGSYPQELQQLDPLSALTLRGPLIMYGQGWCYDGGQDAYRLGAVYRDHWSSPILYARIYQSHGDTSQLPPVCEVQLTALQRSLPDYYSLGESSE